MIPGLLGIYIFGSYANNTMTSESDIDIAFLSFQKISPVDKWKIQENLASELSRNVDLVDLKDASVVLRSEVIENGIRIYTANTYECDNFEVTTYSMYADLNESRIHILNDLKAKYGRNSTK
jgi:predicted nucleotidyltransferase